MACNTLTGNAGNLSCRDGSIFLKPTGIILAQKTFTQTAANFLLQSKWVNAIQAESVFPLMEMKNFEENSTETTYHEYANEDRKLTSQGKYRFTASFDVTECQKKEIMNFRGFSGLIYFVYSNNVIRGRSIDGGANVVGMRLLEFNVEKAKFPLMDGTPEMLTITFSLKDEKDANEFDYAREMSWDVTELDSLTEVTLAQVGSATATASVVSVTVDCYGESFPITGLVTADFAISGAGTLTSATDNNDGTYSLVTTGATDSTVINLVAPSAIVADLLIKSAGGVTLNVT